MAASFAVLALLALGPFGTAGMPAHFQAALAWRTSCAFVQLALRAKDTRVRRDPAPPAALPAGEVALEPLPKSPRLVAGR